jgi:hypothetical protein
MRERSIIVELPLIFHGSLHLNVQRTLPHCRGSDIRISSEAGEILNNDNDQA